MFERKHLGQFVGVLVDQVDEAVQNTGTLLGVGSSPLGLGFCGVGDNIAHLISGRQGHLGLHLTGAGVVDIGKTT